MSAVAFYVSKNLTLAISIGRSFCLLSNVNGSLEKYHNSLILIV
jgi:hypothetical protein